MSSLYVREKVRGWLTSTPGLQLPFFDTVNADETPTVEQWATVAFVTSATEPLDYCGGVEERGTFDYIALGKPGTGDAQLLAAAEHDVALLMQQADATGRLVLQRVSAPEDFFQAGAVPWYTVSVSVDYRYVWPAPVPA